MESTRQWFWHCMRLQVILTQPPFDAGAYAAWVEDAARRGVTQRAKLLVGHPMIRCWTQGDAQQLVVAAVCDFALASRPQPAPAYASASHPNTVWTVCACPAVRMHSSKGNLAFWMELSQCRSRPACQALMAGFAEQDARDRAGMLQFCNEYNAGMVSQVRM
jgi:hypothetical protein